MNSTAEAAKSPTSSGDEDSDDELGALIYQSSETAKRFAAAEAEATLAKCTN